MKISSLLFSVFLLLALSAAAVAQGAPEKKEGMLGSISGKAFLEFKQELDKDANGDYPNTFTVKRVYFAWKKSISKNMLFKVTTDVGQMEADESSGGVALGKGYEVYLKNAYFQWKNDFGFMNMRGRVGILPTPMQSLMYSMSGLRWIDQTVTRAVESTADVGAGLNFGFGKLATLDVAVFNGEGYKKVVEDYYGKAVDTVLHITPLENVFVDGYFTYEAEADGVDYFFFGGAAGWKSELLKTGLRFTMTDGSASVADQMILDAYLNLNMKSFTGVPILIAGLFGYVKPDSGDSTTSFGAGPGYKFNKYVQTMIWFDFSKTGSASATRNIYLKLEAKY